MRSREAKLCTAIWFNGGAQNTTFRVLSFCPNGRFRVKSDLRRFQENDSWISHFLSLHFRLSLGLLRFLTKVPWIDWRICPSSRPENTFSSQNRKRRLGNLMSKSKPILGTNALCTKTDDTRPQLIKSNAKVFNLQSISWRRQIFLQYRKVFRRTTRIDLSFAGSGVESRD